MALLSCTTASMSSTVNATWRMPGLLGERGPVAARPDGV